MRFAFLGSADSWYLRDLQRAASARHRIEPLPFDRLMAALPDPLGPTVASCGQALADFDAVLIRTMAPGSLEQVVFRMDALGQYERRGGVAVNPPRTVEAAVDKYLALAQLHSAGLRVPRTIVCQSAEDAWHAFDMLGGRVVVKPIFGAEGRGIMLVEDEALADRVFRTLEQLRAVLYIQEFIDHSHRDYRLLVVGDRVLGMQRSNPDDWRTNVSRGARAEPLPVDGRLAELAQKAARAVGGSLVGVDVLPARNGELFVIEVNASPGWKALSNATGVDVSRWVLEHLEDCVSRRPGWVPPIAG